jgi:hypothetical protein
VLAKTLLENVRKNGCILYLTIYLQIYPYYPYIVELRFLTIYFKKRALRNFFLKEILKNGSFNGWRQGKDPFPVGGVGGGQLLFPTGFGGSSRRRGRRWGC